MLTDRTILISVSDEDGEPLSGALISIFIGDSFAGEIVSSALGRAMVQAPPTDKVISIEARFDEARQRVSLGENCDRWDFTLPVSQGTHLVLLVHGINTRAHWTSGIRPQLASAGLIAEPAGYGWYGIVRFIIPSEFLRSKAVERVRIRFNAAIALHKPKRVSVIAHSFGTYVVARLIAKEFDIKLHRIIFCGSVVKSTFPFEQYMTRFTAPIINEVGTRDFWPATAESVTWGYGSIGSYGFQGAPLEERWHSGFQHSDFLTVEFADKFWIPFLTHGTIVPGDKPTDLPLLIRLIIAMPLKWILAGGLAALSYLVFAKLPAVSSLFGYY